MASLYAKARVTGIDGTVTYGIVATGTAHLTGLDFTHSWDEDPLISPATGEPIGMSTRKEMLEASVEFIPISSNTGATSTQVEAKKAVVLPPKYGVVTISNVPIGSAGGTGINDVANALLGSTTTYNYVSGGKVTFTPEGDAKITMTLRKYIGTGAGTVADFAILTT